MNLLFLGEIILPALLRIWDNTFSKQGTQHETLIDILWDFDF